MGSPSGATGKVTAPVDASDRKFYVRAAENGNKKALEDFDAALNAQQPARPASDDGSPGGVRAAQDQLTALGFDPGGSDGIAGPRTTAAVRAFQAANGLTVDGIIGPQTQRALDAASNKAAQPPGPPPAVDGSDRKFYIQASQQTGDPAILQRFDDDLQAHNDHQRLQTPVDASDRKFFAQADNPEALEQFDRDLASYNRVKTDVANDYQSRVDHLVSTQGLEPSVAEHFVAQQLEAEGIPRHALPAGATTSQFDHPVDASDRKFYAQSDNPAALQQFDSDLKAYNQYKGIIGQSFDATVDRVAAENGWEPSVAAHFVTQQFRAQGIPEHALPDNATTSQFDHPVDGSDRKFYAQSDNPAALQQFDSDLKAYNQYKGIVADRFESAVDRLVDEHGYTPGLARHIVTQQLEAAGAPSHLLPDNARIVDFNQPIDASDRKFYVQAGDPDALAQFDSDLGAYNQYKSMFADSFEETVDTFAKEQGYRPEVARHLVAMQYSAAGVPNHLLPDGNNSFDPTRVLQEKNEVFDTALQTVNGDVSTGLNPLDLFTGGNGPDGFTATSDIDAIVANPDKFDADVVATAILLQKAINAEGNEEFKAQFEQPSFWQQVKDSPWADPNTDSFVVNLVRGAATPGAYSPAFIERVRTEGPGALHDLGSSLYELSTINQAHLLFTDRQQLGENYRSFAGGVGDWIVDTAKFGVGLYALGDPLAARAIYATTGTNVYQQAHNTVSGGVSAAISDPDELARNVVGWDQLLEDPYRWAGNQAPDIVLEILGTKGAGTVAKAALRGADAAADLADAGRVAGRLDDIPTGGPGGPDGPFGGGGGPNGPFDGGGNGRILPPAQDLVDGFDAQFLRSDVVDGRTVNHLKLGDNHYEVITDLGDGTYDVAVRSDPPPPRAQDFRSDAPPPPTGRPLPTLGGDGSILPRSQELIDGVDAKYVGFERDVGSVGPGGRLDGITVDHLELPDGRRVTVTALADGSYDVIVAKVDNLGDTPVGLGTWTEKGGTSYHRTIDRSDWGQTHREVQGLDEAIDARLNSKNHGTKFEGETADFVSSNGVDIEDLGRMEYDPTTGERVGEIDLETANHIVEIKSGRLSVSGLQDYIDNPQLHRGKDQVLYAPSYAPDGSQHKRFSDIVRAREAGWTVATTEQELLAILKGANNP